MSATATDIDLSVEVDINMPVPCEHPGHATETDWHHGPGELIVRSLTCKNCGWPGRGIFILCRPAWDNAWGNGLYCGECGVCVTRDEAWVLVGEL